MKRYVSRYLWFVIGVVINAFGIALITKAAMGTSPISSVSYVLSLEFPFSLGQFTFAVNMLFILGQAVLLKREFKLVQLLQIAVNVIFSLFIDVGMLLLFWLQPTTLVVQILSLLAGCAVLGLGISIEVAPDVLMVPGEGMVNAIARVSKKRFGTVKILFDVTLVAIAAVLSLVFFGQLRGLGLGTLVSALLVGKFVNLYQKRLPLVARIARLRQPEAEREPMPDPSAE